MKKIATGEGSSRSARRSKLGSQKGTTKVREKQKTLEEPAPESSDIGEETQNHLWQKKVGDPCRNTVTCLRTTENL